MTRIEADARALAAADASLNEAERIEHVIGRGGTYKHRHVASSNRRKALKAWQIAYDRLLKATKEHPDDR